jgi:hypothetical protein
MLGSVLRLAPLLLLLAAHAAVTGDDLDAARRLVQEERFEEAREDLERRLLRDGRDAGTLELLAEALSGLGRQDEAAHHLDRALRLHEEAGDRRGAARATRALQKADPLSARRAKLARDVATRSRKAAEQLLEDGHAERALALARPALPLAREREAEALRALVERILEASSEVDLDGAGEARDEAGAWPLVVLESEHYELHANLEPSVVELVAETMDDIHAYYVQVYFDGDERAAAAAKARIRVHPTRESMLEGWRGGSAPEGWWSPGENQVTCYDTRTTTGSLDWMLETLFHEASHQFMTLLSRRGGSAPTWLNEGTACFFEGATAMADRRVLWPDAALKRLASLAGMLGSGTGPTPAQVVGYAGGGSYPAEYYSFGWGLVYFLQEFEDPETLTHPYRPLYAEYRERVTSKGGDSMALFGEVFLGERSPLGHATFADFERDWRTWILEEVRPLHQAPPAERRALRMARVERYLAAAASAEEDRNPPVDAGELRLRALGHVEYVRRELDGPDAEDPALLALQADLLESIGRDESAAALVERLLELADSGAYAPPAEELAALERRLRDLDRRNYALRSARRVRTALTRSARSLLAEYERARTPLLLRSYTLAARFGAALDDEEVLLPRAAELRLAAREAGVLRGEQRLLAGSGAVWTTTFTELAGAFRGGPGEIRLEAVRPHGLIRTDLLLGDEYELRGELERVGELHRSSVHGLVVAGTEKGDWLVFGLQRGGEAGLWYLRNRDGSGVVTRKLAGVRLEPPPPDGEPVAVRVHASNGEWLELQAGDAAPVRAPWPEGLPRARHAGVYVKDGSLVLRDGVVELY